VTNLLTPPGVQLAWTATSLTTSFGGYNIYRRPARTPYFPWQLVGQITVPTGYTATTVEAQHITWRDYEAGWMLSTGQWRDGWQWAVTGLNATTGVESPVGTVVTASPLPADTFWLTSNAAPWLNMPIQNATAFGGSDSDNYVYANQVAGRDLAVTRTRFETPYRSADLEFIDTSRTGQDTMRHYRAAQAMGQAMALHTLKGERIIGTLRPLGLSYDVQSTINAKGGMVETVRESTGYVIADYNRPAGLVLDGSSQYVTVADNSLLNPSSSGFTVICAAAFAGAGSTKYAVGKGNAGTGRGYWIRTTGSANQLSFFVDGASTTAATTETSSTWFDGNVHVAVATTSGTAQALYRDGNTTAVATGSTTHGAVTNSIAFAAGGNNAGASGLMAAAPIQSWAVYLRVLTAAEIQAASYYLLGYPGYRMPYGPSLFHDLRDQRCWDGIRTSVLDFSGNGLTGTVTGSPPTRGIPWRLELIDRFG